MAPKSLHVVPRDRKWAVRRTGSGRVTKIFDTRKEAIARGRQIARNEGTELYIHDRDGRIRERDSYERNPHLPTG